MKILEMILHGILWLAALGGFCGMAVSLLVTLNKRYRLRDDYTVFVIVFFMSALIFAVALYAIVKVNGPY